MTASSPASNGSLEWLRDLWKRDWLKSLLLVVAVIVAYQPAWHGGFIWDDNTHISENQALRSVGGLWDIWFKPGATCQYYPLSFTVFWLDYHLWGLTPLGYHLQNILLHGLVACLLWQVLKRLEVRAAWLAGAIFALHPVNVMSVAWMTELKNTLAGAFFLGAVWAYLRFAGLGFYETRTPAKTDWRYGLLCLLLFQLAMFAKTAVSFLPVTLLLLAWWKRGRIVWRGMWPVPVMFGIAAGMGLVTLHIEHLHGAAGNDFRMSLIERVLVSGRSFWFYLGKLFFPYPLTFIYERWKIDAGAWWQYAYPAATLGWLGGLCLLRKQIGRGIPAAMLHFYLATSLLVLIQVLYMMRYSFVTDHWQYFGCMSIMAVAAAGIDTALDFITRGRRPLMRAGCGALLLTLGILTWRQAGMYADVETLWQTTLARNPNSFLANNNIGVILVRKGQLEEAIAHFQKALQRHPDDPEARDNLGIAFAKVHGNYANQLVGMGRDAEAIIEFGKALNICPDFADARHDLAVLLLHKGRVDEAIAQFWEIRIKNPDDVMASFDLGNAYFQNGQMDESVASYQIALKIKPDDVAVRNNLGMALLRKGMADEAVVQFRKVLALQPNFTLARTNLDKALFQKEHP